MNASTFFSIFCAIVLAIVSTPTNAEFIDRGGGLIYDSDQDLTWTKDAGLSGWLNWQEATNWVANLVFGGVGGWRLPTTEQINDPTCGGDVRGVLFFEHRVGCTGGEMELLTAEAGPYNYFNKALENGPFENVARTRYWTATPYRDGTDPCIYYPNYDVPCTIVGDDGDRTGFYWQWGFGGFQGGINDTAFKTTMVWTTNRYAWAVHDGDVGAPFPPGDINFDGQVNVADYLLLTQFVLEIGSAPTAAELTAGDMNLNGQLDVGDLVIHSRTVMGLI